MPLCTWARMITDRLSSRALSTRNRARSASCWATYIETEYEDEHNKDDTQGRDRVIDTVSLWSATNRGPEAHDTACGKGTVSYIQIIWGSQESAHMGVAMRQFRRSISSERLKETWTIHQVWCVYLTLHHSWKSPLICRHSHTIIQSWGR